MDVDSRLQTLNEYNEQLKQVNATLSSTENADDRNNLLSLKNDLIQLIELTIENDSEWEITSNANNEEDEVQGTSYKVSKLTAQSHQYELFMAEMQKEGAIVSASVSTSSNPQTEPENKAFEVDLKQDLSALEGTKCRAPHVHTWGDVVYHNALITSVIPPVPSSKNNNSNSSEAEEEGEEELSVKVLFINPTHKEMKPCDYYLKNRCNRRLNCQYSHGETILFSLLEDYIEPDFAGLLPGSIVLAKKDDNLWYRGIIKRILQENETCIVKLDKGKRNASEIEVPFTDLLPIIENNENSDDSDESTEFNDEQAHQDIINISLLIKPSDDKLGGWEQFTRGIGSKLMEKMGYVTGTGLGKRAEGRVDPVTAVVLPAGKSLDHCMELREKSGGDKNLFNVERKLKRMQRKQELRNIKNYEREKAKEKNVFSFLNDTLGKKVKTGAETEDTLQLSKTKTQHRKEIKQESNRNLNVEAFKLEQRIKEVENDIVNIGLTIQRNATSQVALMKQFNDKLHEKQEELKRLQNKMQNIKNEQSLRDTTRKLTVF